MTLDELIRWCDPHTKSGERPEQTQTTWREITNALLENKRLTEKGMKVEMRWSLDAPYTQAILQIPSGISLIELGELEQAILLQLKGVRRALDAEAGANVSLKENAT